MRRSRVRVTFPAPAENLGTQKARLQVGLDYYVLLLKNRLSKLIEKTALLSHLACRAVLSYTVPFFGRDLYFIGFAYLYCKTIGNNSYEKM